MKKAKIYIKKFVRLISFFVILGILISVTTFMVMPKGNSKNDGMFNPNSRGFYSEPKNSLDVVAIGNSNAYSGFSPMELWHNYGITSYVCGEGRQRMSEAVNMLKEVLTFHKPKLVILETDLIFTKSSKKSETNETLNYAAQGIFPIIRYHDRWKDASCQEMFAQPEYKWNVYSKGQYVSNEVKKYTSDDYRHKSNDVREMSFLVKYYLDEFVKICKDNDIPLLFVKLPCAKSWSYDRHNAIQEYADQHNIKYLDYEMDENRHGIDWKTDTRDKGTHLNVRGARKATVYLGQYLKENFDFFEDRRGDSDIAKKWDKDYKKYSSIAKI